jgi:hypothetical protein
MGGDALYRWFVNKRSSQPQENARASRRSALNPLPISLHGPKPRWPRFAEDEEGEPEKHGSFTDYILPLNQRIVQLKHVGANVSWNDRRDHSNIIDGIRSGVFLLVIAVVGFLASR